MGYNYVYNQKVYTTFYQAWIKSPYSWADYLAHLDIGLNLINYIEYGEHNFIIVDQQKWCLARLKYGF